jgi:hypothetical protein
LANCDNAIPFLPQFQVVAFHVHSNLWHFLQSKDVTDVLDVVPDQDFLFKVSFPWSRHFRMQRFTRFRFQRRSKTSNNWSRNPGASRSHATFPFNRNLHLNRPNFSQIFQSKLRWKLPIL